MTTPSQPAQSEREKALEAALRAVADQIDEAMHTAFRKASSHEAARRAWLAVRDLPAKEWANVIEFILSGLGVREALELPAAPSPDPLAVRDAAIEEAAKKCDAMQAEMEDHRAKRYNDGTGNIPFAACATYSRETARVLGEEIRALRSRPAPALDVEEIAKMIYSWNPEIDMVNRKRLAWDDLSYECTISYLDKARAIIAKVER